MSIFHCNQYIFFMYLKCCQSIKTSFYQSSPQNGGHYPSGGSNLPLKGQKTELWEGGTRVPAFIYAPPNILKGGKVLTG